MLRIVIHVVMGAVVPQDQFVSCGSTTHPKVSRNPERADASGTFKSLKVQSTVFTKLADTAFEQQMSNLCKRFLQFKAGIGGFPIFEISPERVFVC